MNPAPFGIVLRHIRRLAHCQPGAAVPDSDLLQTFARTGDEGAFAALLERYGPLVLRVCQRVLGQVQDAEDAFQATFLVLARKADSVSRREAVGGWLYGVAHRVARNAQRAALVRRGHEAQATPRAAACSADELTWREVRQVLDAELLRLPEKYRLPLVLCYLEGQTQEEAARQLGWSTGVLRGRLDRGRERLRDRLTRRGITLSAALGAALLAQGTVSAGVSAALHAATVPAALVFRLGGAAGHTTAHAQTLAEEALAALAPARAASAASLVVIVGALSATAVALVSWFGHTAQPAPAGAPSAAAAAPVEAPPRIDRLGDPLPPEALARIGTYRLRHGDSVGPVAFAPGGKVLAATARDRTLCLWDITTGRAIRRFPGEPQSVCALAFTPDGKVLVTVANDGKLRRWAVDTGEQQFSADLPHHEMRGALALAPDASAVAIAQRNIFQRKDHSPDVTIHDTATGKRMRSLAGPRKDVTALAFAPDATALVAASRDDALWVWDTAAGKETRRLDGVPEVMEVAVAPDGRTLGARAGAKDTLRLWDIPSGKELGSFPAPRLFAFTPDGKGFVRGEDGFGLSRCELATGKLLRAYPSQYTGGFRAVSFSPDGQTMAAGSSRNAVVLWDVATGEPRDPAVGLRGPPEKIALLPDGQSVVISAGSAIRQWETTTAQPRTAFGPRFDWCHDQFALSPDGTILASELRQTIYFWDVATGRELRRFRYEESIQYAARTPDTMAFSPDGKLLALGNGNGTVYLWEAQTGKRTQRIAAHKSQVRSVAFAPDGKALTTAGYYDYLVRRWDVATGAELHQFSMGPTNNATVAPDGHTVAVTSQIHGNNTIQVHSFAPDSRRTIRLEGHDASVGPMVFTMDSRILITGGRDATVRLWEVATGQEIRRLVTGQGGITALAVSRDQRLLVTGGADTTALVWDLTTGRAGTRLSRAEMRRHWEALAGAEGAQAYRAVQALADDPAQVLPFVRDHLGRAPGVDEARLRRWIADLDSDDFDRREQAGEALGRLAERAAPALRRALADRPPLEVHSRAEALLARLNGPIRDAQTLRGLRAVALLEMLGTPEAQQQLTDLTGGAADAPLTRAAKAALDRLAGQPPAP